MSNSKADIPEDAKGEVGYGKPPVGHRFRPGKSGNPGGRPKGANGRRATVKRS